MSGPEFNGSIKLVLYNLDYSVPFHGIMAINLIKCFGDSLSICSRAFKQRTVDIILIASPDQLNCFIL